MDYSSGYNKRPWWQWLIIYLIIGGLVYAAIYYFYINKQSRSLYGTALNPTQSIGQTSITYSSTGFQPGRITIKAGDTVNWTNQSGTDVGLNSAPHPSHTDYPPLNIGIIQNSDSASLIFPVPGVYKYHNHLNSSHYGSITVQ